MPLRRPEQRGSGGTKPYRSLACHIGTHHECRESVPKESPADLPVIYETCNCACHAHEAARGAGKGA